ncbi:T9SS type A sorting domain-containing protein, partial [Algibacter mikhailovii]|uniref:T9SS type A sorting domain-containing protein n=1 Tax=Algibacter mikhailovii TaxID=425498 RepID=UPI002493F956
LKVGTAIPLEKGVQAMKVLFSGSHAEFELNNITISLVEADPDPVNLAPIHGTASQSIASDPCPYGGCAELAIDGNTDGNFGNGSVSHSDHNVNPKWWQVDLGNDYKIETINIYNRTGYESRLNNFTVEVINTQGAVVYSHLYVDSPKPLLSIATGGVIGSIVKISKTSAHGITLAEVEVYGIDSSVLSTATTQMDDEIELFPNPTSSSFTLTNCAGTQITIFDTLGKMVHRGAIHSERQTVDISYLEGGLYFIEIENNGSIFIKKIIKK